MAKKKTPARKPGGAASIAVVQDPQDEMVAEHEFADEAPPKAEEPKASKAERKPKAKAEPSGTDNFGVSEIRKAATFANSVGGLDKAICLLQILKVAKEVQ